MRVYVLGCSGAIARGCRTTSFLLDGDVLIDAGTGVGDLDLEQMACIDHVLLTQVGQRQGLKLKGGLAPHLRRRLVDYIEQHLDQPLALSGLAQLAALSEYHFARMFSTSFGLPPHRYVLQRRLRRARELLLHSDMPLGEIALACGFASASHFSNRFRQAFGAAPGLLRATRPS